MYLTEIMPSFSSTGHLSNCLSINFSHLTKSLGHRVQLTPRSFLYHPTQALLSANTWPQGKWGNPWTKEWETFSSQKEMSTQENQETHCNTRKMRMHMDTRKPWKHFFTRRMKKRLDIEGKWGNTLVVTVTPDTKRTRKNLDKRKIY